MTRLQINQRKRQLIFERDKFTCVNCGAKGEFSALEVDHIIPVVSGGTNDYENLQTLCYKCNMDKRFGKDIKNIKDSKFKDLNPLEKLDLIKERLELYKHLTYPEFKVVFTQDELFKCLRLDLLYLNDLFYDISNQVKGNNRSDKSARDKYIEYLYKNTELTQEQIAKIGNLGSKTIWSSLHKD